MRGRLRQKALSLPIIYRIAIGNAMVIAIGAVGGTLLTRHLANQDTHLWLIPLFLFLGTTLSVFTNFVIIKSALRPLRELVQRVPDAHASQPDISPQLLEDNDPDIVHLARSIDSLVHQLEERNRELRALSERAINAQEDERKRIALSLHDDTGQALSMLIIHLEQLQKGLPAELTELHTRLEAAHQLAAQTLIELRKIISGLRPTVLDDLGLVPAIRWYARAHLEEAGVRVQVTVDEESLPLPAQLNATLFRIAQEAVNNILRHAGAGTARISLCRSGNEMRLQVEDDGQGFDLQQIQGEAVKLQHLGLLGIQERAELVGGKVTVNSIPGRGTQLLVSVPVPLSGNGYHDG